MPLNCEQNLGEKKHFTLSMFLLIKLLFKLEVYWKSLNGHNCVNIAKKLFLWTCFALTVSIYHVTPMPLLSL